MRLFLLLQLFLFGQFFFVPALQSLGFLLALLFEKGGFHSVEGFEEAFFPCYSFLAIESHGENSEAVTGETVGGIFSDRTVAGFRRVGRELKIELSKFGRTFQILDIAEDILVLLAKCLSNGQRGSERHAVFGLDHVLDGWFKDFLSFGGGDFSFRHVRLLPCLYCVFRVVHGVFSLAETCPVLCWSVCSIP